MELIFIAIYIEVIYMFYCFIYLRYCILVHVQVKVSI